MKLLPLILSVLILSFISSISFAADPHPEGTIDFYNATPHTITAQVNTSKFILLPKQSKSMKYEDLSIACEPNTARCKAQFFKNDVDTGFATINTITGSMVSLNLTLKVLISKDSENVVRHVTIEQ